MSEVVLAMCGSGVVCVCVCGHGHMGAWVHGHMGAWTHGCMGTWVHVHVMPPHDSAGKFLAGKYLSSK